MNRRTAIVAVAVAAGVIVLAAGIGVGWLLGGGREAPGSMESAADRAAHAGHESAPRADTDAHDGRQVLYWYDPMHPQQRFEQPGPSPFMDMDLVPMYAEPGEAGQGVRIDPRLTQNLGLRTAPVERARLHGTLRSVGAVHYDARLEAVVTAPVAGIVTAVHRKATLEAVAAGTPLATLLAPEWSAAQAEYRALLAAGADPALMQAARGKLQVLGMPAGTIARLEAGGDPAAQVTLHAPRAGVLAQVMAREGDSVMRGAPLFTVNGLERVWIEAEVPEAQAGAVRPGLSAQVSVPAYPGRVFEATVEARLPQVTAATRTQRVRLAVTNHDGALSPGMFATVRIDLPEAPPALLVPTEALIVTGERTVVVLRDGDGRFRVVEVVAGASHGGRTQILDGLVEGQNVVRSGQFLIDSEASLRQQAARIGGDGDTP
ncbi:MAG TPA: efflux RND transporter periplasmic adaptor subunit [Xanthomonadaceae bacterium]|nr:efflux RND transporter periplasmic adaptor subunit [Xanthomonadaceae bacterium]